MTCPTIDKLSQYADGLLIGQEVIEIRQHLESCGQCRGIVAVFEEEQQFIKETLKEPTLPTEFTRHVLNELTPYPQKKKQLESWKRMLLVAAGFLLAITLSAVFNPSFAGNLGGLFTTGKVDEGLRIATEEGLTEGVDLSVSDKGLTITVEDMIADTSRIALSYQITNKKGQSQKIAELKSEVFITDQNDMLLKDVGESWYALGDYGLFELSLRDYDLLGKMVVHIRIQEMNGVKGDWHIELPVEFEESIGETDDFNWLEIRGQGLEPIGRVRHVDSLNPFEKGEDFKFVLEGVLKTVPTFK